MNRVIIATVLLICAAAANVFAQEHTENNKDQALRGSGRVNASTLGMEFGLPLGSYAGRGIDIPVSLNYSSKVWRMDSKGSHPIRTDGGTPRCVTLNEAKFAEHSAAGWTSSMQEVYVEYTGYDEQYNGEGYPIIPEVDCYPPISTGNNHGSYVRRIQLHLPDGSSHELRMDEQPLKYDLSGSCADPYAPCANNPSIASNWNGWYYAVDGSNLRYYENRTDNEYYLQLPDGSKYTFDSLTQTNSDYKTIRKSGLFTDPHGNRMTYHQPNSSLQPDFPNGYWIDTLGRAIGVPLPVNEPSSPGVQEYKMPGISGQSAPVYKFHWKKLKGADASSSALSDFNQSLKYLTNWAGDPEWNTEPERPASTVLFRSEQEDWATSDNELFNPILLAAIELPDGQRYEFGYNEYGEVVTIKYPTGGKETFTMQTVPALVRPSTGELLSNKQSNRGVVSRKVYESVNSTSFYEWIYLAERINPEFRTVITNPDLTRTERYLYQGVQNRSLTNGSWGYSDALTGMAYKEESYNASNQLTAKKLTTWSKKSIPITYTNVTADYNTRVTQEENVVYDPVTGGALSSTTKYEYAGDLDQRDTPLLQNIVRQYPFVVSGAALPANPEKTAETIFLQYDSTVDQTIRTSYRNLNMVGLVTGTMIRDASDTVKARSQIVYDEPAYLETAIPSGVPGWTNPGTSSFRGLPTTTRSWSDVVNNQFIETHALYDKLGNVKKSWDGKGNYSEISYADNYADSTNRNSYALPTETKSYSGASGTGTQMTTSVKYDFNTGLPTLSTDANGQTTEMQYIDALLRPTKTIAPNGHQTIIQYGAPDASGTFPAAQRFVKTKTQIDANNWKEGYSWFDGLGRTVKSQSVDSNGDVFALTCYDAVGRVLKTSNPFRNVSNPGCSSTSLEWTTNTFDAAGRPWKVTTPDNAVVETNYGLATSGNNLGAVATVTDQAGKQRRSIMNALGQLERVDEMFETKDSTGNVISVTLGSIASPAQPTVYGYDPLGNLASISQGAQTRSFVYDSLSRLKTANNPESGLIQYEYDNNGNLTKKTDARLVDTNYSYDALNRVVSRSYANEPATQNPTPAVTYYYDDIYFNDANQQQTATGAVKGQLISVSSSVSRTNYSEFDQMGRVLKSQQITDGAAYPEMTYTYNLSGALVEQKYPSGRVVKNVLDADGDLSIVQSKKNQTAGFWNYADNFTYTAAGAVSSMQLGNGRWESTQFNERLQPLQIALGTVQNGTDKLKLNYEYGTLNAGNGQVIAGTNNGNIGKQTITAPTEVRNGLTHNGFTAVQYYVYDSLNRIKVANENITPTGQAMYQAWGQTFDYDRFGNRKFKEVGTTASLNFPKNCGGTMCQADKKIFNPQAQTSDNRLSAADGYQYDSAGNMTRDAQSRKFTYDAENKQTKVQTVDSDGTVTATLGEYFYDGDGKRVKKYVPGTGETTVFVYDIDGKLIAENSTLPAPTQTVSYLTNDHLGSPRINTDQNGNVTARHDYQPYGEEIQRASYGVDINRKQFTGYERDAELELDFAQARYYNRSIGRFYSVDPENYGANEDDPQLWNAYGYARNNPVLYSDPNGLEYKVCNQEGQCWTHSDAEFKKGKKQASSLYKQTGKDGDYDSGNILDSDGNVVGTYERTSIDPDYQFVYGVADQSRRKTRTALIVAGVAVGTGVCLGTGTCAAAAGYLLRGARVVSGTKAALCFVAGTPILTENGLKPIEKIKEGDKVLSYNEETKQTEYKTVVGTRAREAEAERILSVKIEGEAEALGVTGEHPFYVRTYQTRTKVSEKGDEDNWIEAKNLKIGDEILKADGDWARVESISQRKEGATVYNFTVQDNHNYFAGQTSLLVHNGICDIILKKTMSGKEVVKEMTKNGFKVVKQTGDHVQLKYPGSGAKVTVPLHKNIATGTFKSIEKQIQKVADTLK